MTGALIIISLSIPLSLFTLFFLIAKYPQRIGRYLWLFVYCFAMVVYCYSPTYDNDLYRYYQEIDACASMPFAQAFTWGNDGLFVKNFLFWILAKIDQKNLLQAITVGTLYGAMGYIVSDSVINSRKLYNALLICFLLLPIHLITNNIRNMLAFSLSILGIYRDLVNRRRGPLTWTLYLLPCFIHMASLVLLLERILLPYIKRHYKTGGILIIGIPFLVVNFYPITRNITIPGPLGRIIERAIWKSYTTIVGSSAYAMSTHESGYNNACRIIMFVFCLQLGYICLRRLQEIRRIKGRYFDFIVFDFMICVFTCVYDLTGAIKYWVFAVAAVLCGIPLITQIMDGTLRYKVFRIDVRLALISIAAMRGFLELYYMSSRINFNEFFYNILTKNGFVVLYRVLEEIMKI